MWKGPSDYPTGDQAYINSHISTAAAIVRNCSSCGCGVQDRHNFCSNCGSKIDRLRTRSSNQCKTSGCGAILNEDDRFCWSCGAKII